MTTALIELCCASKFAKVLFPEPGAPDIWINSLRISIFTDVSEFESLQACDDWQSVLLVGVYVELE